MTQEEYFSQRLEEQIAWYDKAGKKNKTLFQLFKVGEIVVASVTPFLIAHSDVDGGPLHVIAATMSITIAILAAMLGAFKFQEKWIQFRSVSEQLKHEKFMYLTQSGVYEKRSSFPAFVKRIEIILIRENDDWMKLVSSQDAKPEDDAPEGDKKSPGKKPDLPRATDDTQDDIPEDQPENPPL